MAKATATCAHCGYTDILKNMRISGIRKGRYICADWVKCQWRIAANQKAR